MHKSSWCKRSFPVKIVIVDDDVQSFKYLKSLLSEALGSPAEFSYFKSGEDFLKSWQPGVYDVIILDIFMNGITGVDAAKEIRKTDPDVKIVFSTASNEFASESYEVNACYYLRKPFGKEKIKNMLDRLDIPEIEKMRAVKLPDGRSVILRDIIYTDCASHCIAVHCKQNREIVLRANFSDIESVLCQYSYFFSPTKGMIINFYEVTAQNGDTFRMSDGSIVPISRRKANEVLETYSSFCFEQLREGEYK